MSEEIFEEQLGETEAPKSEKPFDFFLLFLAFVGCIWVSLLVVAIIFGNGS